MAPVHSRSKDVLLDLTNEQEKSGNVLKLKENGLKVLKTTMTTVSTIDMEIFCQTVR